MKRELIEACSGFLPTGILFVLIAKAYKRTLDASGKISLIIISIFLMIWVITNTIINLKYILKRYLGGN